VSRAASSPFLRDIPLPQALAAWAEARAEAGCPERVDAVSVPVGEALGRVTAEPVWASRSSPAYDAAAMDGIAVRAADTVGASESRPLILAAGAFDEVDTGDEMPPGRDAVVMREHVHRMGDQAELRSAAPPYQHVRSIGEDVAATELLLPAGHRLRAFDLAAAAAAGAERLQVYRAPELVVIPSGDEIRPVGEPVEPGEIPDTNSLMLAAQARELGVRARVQPIVPDDPDQIAAALRAAAPQADVVILVAGSSAGRDDYTADVVRAVGRLAVHGVAVRPGHPVVLGVVGTTPVIGVPGYPVSAALTFDIFAAPLLARAAVRTSGIADGQTVRLSFDILRPIPIDRLTTATRVLRPGRSVEQIEATLSDAAGEALMRHVLADAPPPPGAPTVTGRDAVADFWRGAVAAMNVQSLRLHTLSLDVFGDQAQEVGRAELAVEGGGAPMALKYVVLWKREDGGWRMDVDIWNADS